MSKHDMSPETEAPFVEKPRRNKDKWGKGKKGDNWNQKALKGYKNRMRELHEDALDDDVRDYL